MEHPNHVCAANFFFFFFLIIIFFFKANQKYSEIVFLSEILLDKFYGTKKWGWVGWGGVGVPTTLIFFPFYPIVKHFFISVGLFCLLLFLFVVGLFACLFVCFVCFWGFFYCVFFSKPSVPPHSQSRSCAPKFKF